MGLSALKSAFSLGYVSSASVICWLSKLVKLSSELHQKLLVRCGRPDEVEVESILGVGNIPYFVKNTIC